jgi:hypothetical protein
MSGTRPRQSWAAFTTCRLAALVAWVAAASPAAGAYEWFDLGCNPVSTWEDGARAFDPGAEIDCHMYVYSPEPTYVFVELRRAGTDETVTLYGGGWQVEWDDHEVWFSFVSRPRLAGVTRSSSTSARRSTRASVPTRRRSSSRSPGRRHHRSHPSRQQVATRRRRIRPRRSPNPS